MAQGTEDAPSSQEDWARGRERFLAEVTEELAHSLDYETVLRTATRMAVPRLADWCGVEVLSGSGRLVRGAVAHNDPDRERWVAEDVQRFPSAASQRSLAELEALEGPALVEDLDGWLAADAAGDERRSAGLAMLELRSAAVVPLRARGRLLGALSLAMAESSRTYSGDDLELFRHLAPRYAIALDNARLFRDQQRIAMRLQRNLRPGRLPAVDGLDVAALYQPVGDGAQAGGDFYDLFPGAHGAWVATIGDVSGKGIDAAASSALMRRTLRAAASGQGRLRRALALADEVMYAEDEEDRLCSAVLVRLNVTLGRAQLTLANAGHPPPLVVRSDGGIDRPELAGTILGVPSIRLVPETALELVPGDALVLYTDGVIEARIGDGLFGEERLQDALRPCAGGSAGSIVAAVRQALSPPVALRDDVAVMVLAMPSVE